MKYYKLVIIMVIISVILSLCSVLYYLNRFSEDGFSCVSLFSVIKDDVEIKGKVAYIFKDIDGSAIVEASHFQKGHRRGSFKTQVMFFYRHQDTRYFMNSYFVSIDNNSEVKNIMPAFYLKSGVILAMNVEHLKSNDYFFENGHIPAFFCTNSTRHR